jgi:hypothetical protein
MSPSIKSLTALANNALAPGQLLNAVITRLIRADASRSAGMLLKLARFQHRHKRAAGEEVADADAPKPTGPFTVDAGHACALLVFVPLSLKSRLIDDATGGYGYSHVALDCAEVDQESGKHVMTESTMQYVVHRSFQERYGSRPFARVPLSQHGVEAEKFRACVNEKLGEPYDDKEALTWGAVNDPAKEVCSDLAADCLPSELRADIAREHRAGRLSRLSVSDHRRFKKEPRVFVSPNGLAEYFGAPRGSRITAPDTLVTPKRPVTAKPAAGLKRGRARIVVLTLIGAVFIAWLLSERSRSKKE